MGNETIEKIVKVIKAMAEEISSLRINNDLEWGEYEGENADYYNVDKIIEEFMKEFE